MSMQRVAINTAVVLGTLTVVFLAFKFQEALILFVFSLAAAAATRPYIEALIARGMLRSRAIILVYLLFAGFLALILVAAGSQFLKELQFLTDAIAHEYDRVWIDWPAGNAFQKMIIQQLPQPAELYQSFSLEQPNSALVGLFGITMNSFNFLAQLMTVLILSIYWNIDRVHFERLWLSLLPVESRARSRDIWRNIEYDFGAYIRSEVLQSIFAGLLLGIGLWLMGVQYPILLAFFAALAWLVPWLGGVLVLAPVALAGFTQSVGLGILATSYAIAVLVFLEFYLEARFIRRQQYSSLLSILLIIALIEPFGLMGIIVAPPLAAAIQLVFRYYLTARPTMGNLPEKEQISRLHEKLALIRQISENISEPLQPPTQSLLNRLEDLVDRTVRMVEKEKTQPELPGGRLP